MPTPGVERELRDAGYMEDGQAACPRCQRMVDIWRSPGGKKVPWNPLNHPTAPGVLHSLTCGEESDLKRLQGDTDE